LVFGKIPERVRKVSIGSDCGQVWPICGPIYSPLALSRLGYQLYGGWVGENLQQVVRRDCNRKI